MTAVSGAKRSGELTHALTSFIQGFDLSTFTMAYLHHGNIEKQSRDFSVLSTYPEPLLEEYVHGAYATHDPVYKAGLTPGTLVTWNRSLSRYRCSKERMVMEGASSHGLKEGLALSF